MYWNAFDKPYEMYSQKPGGGYFGSSIEYDADFRRVFKSEANCDDLGINQSIVRSTIYVGKEYQLIKDSSGARKHRYAISAGNSVVQIDRKDNSGKDEPKYLLADSLGSTNLVVNSLGLIEQKLAFDPWGMRVKADTSLIEDEISVNKTTSLGYTGHEMDDEAGLVNMRARIYDPYLGRFLSPDSMVSASILSYINQQMS